MRDDATPSAGDHGATAGPGHDALARAELRLRTLQRLLGVGGTGLRAAVDEAAALLAEAFGADKVDVFLYRAERDRCLRLPSARATLG